MAKIGEKEAQQRVLREALAQPRKEVVAHYPGQQPSSSVESPGPDKTPPLAIRVAPGAGIFDRVAYQREYMRKWRARKKGS